jgi:uncharacterized protein
MCPPSEDSSPRLTVSALSSPFSPTQRRLLLQLAHQSIMAALDHRELSAVPPDPYLAKPRGVFTTLYYRDSLRGCVGYVLPTTSVYRSVIETARGAAFDDPRFAPVTRDEAVELEVSLSILSPPKPVHPEAVEVGCHGLLIRQGTNRGLLLPQVPVEHQWDRITFLEQTCKKAGLPPDAWQRGAQIEVFTAEVFGERTG